MIFYRKWQPVAALTFDLDDTFYDNGPVIRTAENTMLQYLVAQYPNTQDKTRDFWLAFRRETIQDIPEYRYDMIQLRREVLKRGLFACGYQGEILKQAVDNVYGVFSEARSNFRVSTHVQDILATLAERYPLVAITNGNVELDKIGIADYFQLSLHASAAQPAKPDKCMFQKASEYLQLSPEKILHVGDNLITDVLGGANFGCKTGWYAFDREMHLHSEPVKVLPDVQFADLQEMIELLC